MRKRKSMPAVSRGLAIAIALIGLQVATGGGFLPMVHAQSEAPSTSRVTPPVPPEPPPADSRRDLAERDSIFAKEILIDASGVTVTDRDGKEIRIEGTRLRIPPTPLDWGEGGPHEIGTGPEVIHVFADVITIEPDEVTRGDVICIFGGHIKVLGTVEGSVVSIFGTIDVEGTVNGDAVAPFGAVRVGPNATVGRDVVASKIDKEPGGRIAGMRNELFFNLFGDDWANRSPYWGQAALTVLVAFKILFAVFLVLLAHALAAKNVARVKGKIQVSFFKSFFMGALAQILSLPLILLLIVTIVGIPVALFLLPLMFVAAIVLSLAAFGLWMGEMIDQNTTLRLPSPLSRTLVGLLAIQSIWLIPIVALWGSRMGSISESLKVVSVVSLGIGVVMSYVIVTTGSGAVILTRFGTRPKDPVDPPQGSESTDAVGDSGDESPKMLPSPLPLRPTEEPGAAHAAG